MGQRRGAGDAPPRARRQPRPPQPLRRFPARLHGLLPTSGSRAFRLGFITCLLGCFLITLVLSPWLGTSQGFGSSGHDGYLQIAANLIRGHGFVFEPGDSPVLHRAPVYPLLIAPLTLLPEAAQRPVLILLQAALVGGICFLLFGMASSLFSPRAGCVAVLVFLFNPWVYLNAKNPMPPILQAFLYLLFLFLLWRGRPGGYGGRSEGTGWGERAAIGSVAAALMLSHGAMILVPPTLLGVLLVRARITRRPAELRRLGAAAGLMLLLLLPWCYRNWLVTGSPSPVAGNFGRLYATDLRHWDLAADDFRVTFRRAELDYSGLSDPRQDAALNREAIRHALTHPGMLLKRVSLNAIQYYFPALARPYQRRPSPRPREDLALSGLHLLLWALAGLGVWRHRTPARWDSPCLPLLGFILLYAIWYWPFVTHAGHGHYALGTIPLLSLLAGAALVRPDPART